jgi:beta-glucosidase/6-phospho-beta-glucosidase/beta-galactosidase
VSAAGPAPALWGGFECSLTRIGGAWRDQLAETGHDRRPRDLAEAAALGLRALRVALHWERLHDAPMDGPAWRHARERLAQMRALGLGIVAGLVHHGSGPAGTGLLDPGFPEALARFAGRAARACPDALAWTPVNEPLTTARFACLYGVWYPHRADTPSFLRATAHQCRAVLLAMRAIRAVQPGARLLQTEDIARVFATPRLAAQAAYENDRRWLSLDLLCGRVDRRHPLRAALEEAGVAPAHLDELAEGEARPDWIGANHYVTSDRFLDHRTALHPPALRGGNGRQAYADTEAVRAHLPEAGLGWAPRLRELWQRYRLPIVISEVQLGGADEAEQARWFAEAWDAARALRAEGAELPAVTVWALGGAVDWDTLMRERRGAFECGVWQAGGDYRPRLIARLLPGLAAGGTLAHPALAQPGWWRRADRVPPRLYG